MTRRHLPPEEWWRLAGTELETVWPHLDPDRSVVIVVEDAGVIVGCWALFEVLHAEGVYIDPAYRQQGHVARLLLKGLVAAAREQGATTIATASLTPDVTALAERLGGIRIPGEHFVMTVEELCRPRSQSH